MSIYYLLTFRCNGCGHEVDGRVRLDAAQDPPLPDGWTSAEPGHRCDSCSSRRRGLAHDAQIAQHLQDEHGLDWQVATGTEPLKLHAHHHVEHRFREFDHDHEETHHG